MRIRAWIAGKATNSSCSCPYFYGGAVQCELASKLRAVGEGRLPPPRIDTDVAPPFGIGHDPPVVDRLEGRALPWIAELNKSGQIHMKQNLDAYFQNLTLPGPRSEDVAFSSENSVVKRGKVYATCRERTKSGQKWHTLRSIGPSWSVGRDAESRYDTVRGGGSLSSPTSRCYWP